MRFPRATTFKHLGSQVIDVNGPGTVLRDFETLLEFVGTDGVPAGGKYHLLPMNRLFELDEQLAHPLRPTLKRPQQHSFPHIHGLYLLLRATELGVSQGVGKKSGRLVLAPAALANWQTLNVTERYFNLLEAWLRHASWDMAGGQGGGWMSKMATEVRQLWRDVPADGLKLGPDQPMGRHFDRIESRCILAMFDLFGLFAVRRNGRAGSKNRAISEVRHTPFGDELLTLVFDEIQRENFGEATDLPSFGAWQPRLQEYFPDWRRNYELPEAEFRDGSHTFKVSLGSVWRRIVIPAESDLDELATSIIQAFEFDGDHLYQFQLRHRDGSQFLVDHPYVRDGEFYTDEISIGYLPLTEKDTMTFIYDLGGSWRFDVRLEKIDSTNDDIKEATIIESHGDAPKEYDWDDDDEDDDDEDDDVEDDD